MAELDNLLSQIEDDGLRTQLKAQVDLLTRQMRFGLVFERHIPESVRDYGAPIAVGDIVAIRAEINGGDDYTVAKLNSRTAEIISVTSRESRKVKPRELVAVKRFGEAAYPALRPLGAVRRSADRPAHGVINGENYHTIQLLRYLYRGRFDCIYLDPPYNTGNSDWQYNNRYIDDNDRWRHSKWLSFMERRLEIAKDLLKPDGVLVVTIDEHEVHHLGVLLEQIFTGYLQYTVTIVHNPKGTGKVNFSRVNEYAIYCVPDTGEDVILGLPVEEADALAGRRTEEHRDQTDDELVVSEDTDDDGDLTITEGDLDVAAAALDVLPFPAEELPQWNCDTHVGVATSPGTAISGLTSSTRCSLTP